MVELLDSSVSRYFLIFFQAWIGLKISVGNKRSEMCKLFFWWDNLWLKNLSIYIASYLAISASAYQNYNPATNVFLSVYFFSWALMMQSNSFVEIMQANNYYWIRFSLSDLYFWPCVNFKVNLRNSDVANSCLFLSIASYFLDFGSVVRAVGWEQNIRRFRSHF